MTGIFTASATVEVRIIAILPRASASME